MLLTISRFLQILLTGLYTGLLFADRIGVTPIRPKLPVAAFVLYQQQLHSTFGKLMPVLLVGSLLAGALSLALLRRDYRSREFIFTTIATLCTLCVVIVTRLINVPINETLMTWQVSSPPENVMQLWAPWEGAHTIRTAIALLGFASLCYAVTSRLRNTNHSQ
jgi:ABC-type Na+ efflux pump permease subunit